MAESIHDLFSDVPVTLTVTVGRARLPIRDLLGLGRNAILELDSRIDDPVAIRAGDRIVAYGELQEAEGTEGGLVVRVTELVGATDDA